MYLDGHADLLWDVVQGKRRGEEGVLERYHREQLLRGGAEGIVLATADILTPNSF